jgi:hypothetical protein
MAFERKAFESKHRLETYTAFCDKIREVLEKEVLPLSLDMELHLENPVRTIREKLSRGDEVAPEQVEWMLDKIKNDPDRHGINRLDDLINIMKKYLPDVDLVNFEVYWEEATRSKLGENLKKQILEAGKKAGTQPWFQIQVALAKLGENLTVDQIYEIMKKSPKMAEADTLERIAEIIRDNKAVLLKEPIPASVPEKKGLTLEELRREQLDQRKKFKDLLLKGEEKGKKKK